MPWPLLALLLLLLGAPRQDGGLPTREALAARLAQAEAGDEAAPEVEALRAALVDLDRREAAIARATEERAAADEVPAQVEELRRQLSGEAGEPPLPDAAELGLEAREGELARAGSALGAARAQLEELRARRGARDDRREVVLRQRAEAQKERAALEEGLGPVAGEARLLAREARRAALAAELAALEAEALALERRRELLPLRVELAEREVARAERQERHWQDLVAEARRLRAEVAAGEAQRLREEAIRRFPGLASLAERNEELAGLRSGESGLPLRIAAAQAARAAARELVDEVRRRAERFERRRRLAGAGEGRGRALRADYEWLPSEGALRERARRQGRQQAEAFELVLDVEEELDALGRMERDREAFLAELGEPRPSAELRALVTELLAARRRLLEAVEADAQALLAELDAKAQVDAELDLEVGALRSAIEKRILWVRSVDLAFPDSLAELPAALAGVLTQERWAGVPGDLASAAGRSGPEMPLALVLSLLTLLLRPWLLRRRRALAESVRSYRTDRLRHSVEALLLCLVQALPLPLLLWALADVGEEAREAAARALGVVGAGLLAPAAVLELLRQVLRERGFGEAHLRWPARPVNDLRRELLWFEPVVLALGALVLLFGREGLDAYTGTLGRLAFVALAIVSGLFLFRLLRGDGLLPADLGGGGLLGRTRRAWGALFVGLPVLCLALSLLGYHYAAVRLFERLLATLGFGTALVLANALLLRWLFITRRRLAIEQARDRSRARREAADGGEGAALALDEEAVDIPALDAQTRQLFRSGLNLAAVVGVYLIWAGTLPALQGLDRVQLWPRLEVLDAPPAAVVELAPAVAQVVPTGGAGAGDAAPEEGPPVGPAQRIAAAAQASGEGLGDSLGLPAALTLADLLLALILALVTGIAARNLPGLLEISVLQRLPRDAGARYAGTPVVRFRLVLVGVSVVSSTLGLGWKKVQWLAAALTFGLAFGLQEIFANFVSGLIILLERPVRVGDIVTVGGVEGRVTQLRMRATTIRDWDRREFLIPNKELITGSVINWTLSDPITRIIVPVGIAYGSDTELARRLLLEVARANPYVLEDPPPAAIFRRFGESCLDFELRIFLANRDLWQEVVDGLHSAIDDAFRGAGIEIAFPQRDLHVRSLPEGWPAPGGGGAAPEEPA